METSRTMSRSTILRRLALLAMVAALALVCDSSRAEPPDFAIFFKGDPQSKINTYRSADGDWITVGPVALVVHIRLPPQPAESAQEPAGAVVTMGDRYAVLFLALTAVGAEQRHEPLGVPLEPGATLPRGGERFDVLREPRGDARDDAEGHAGRH